MKIALINNSFSSTHGGLERFSINLTRALLAEGHQVHLFARRFEDVPDGAQLHLVESPDKPSFLRVWRFARQVQEQLKSIDFDVVYGLVRSFPLDCYRMGDGVQRHWLRLRYPNPFWRWLNCLLNPTHLVNLWLERQVFALSNCRFWVANSALCKGHAERYLGVPAERVRVIYNGVDHEAFNPSNARVERVRMRQELGLENSDILLVYVSNNWKRKGLKVVLDAMGRLGDKAARMHLLVVGRGRPERFKSAINSCGLEGRVHFYGTARSMASCYGAGDLLVLPTQYDPFSNVCLEAMACGLPVVTTLENGASELVIDGANGYRQSNPLDSVELASLLGQCVTVEPLAEMGRKALVTAADFTIERNLQQTLELFRELEKERAASSSMVP